MTLNFPGVTLTVSKEADVDEVGGVEDLIADLWAMRGQGFKDIRADPDGKKGKGLISVLSLSDNNQITEASVLRGEI